MGFDVRSAAGVTGFTRRGKAQGPGFSVRDASKTAHGPSVRDEETYGIEAANAAGTTPGGAAQGVNDVYLRSLRDAGLIPGETTSRPNLSYEEQDVRLGALDIPTGAEAYKPSVRRYGFLDKEELEGRSGGAAEPMGPQPAAKEQTTPLEVWKRMAAGASRTPQPEPLPNYVPGEDDGPVPLPDYPGEGGGLVPLPYVPREGAAAGAQRTAGTTAQEQEEKRGPVKTPRDTWNERQKAQYDADLADVTGGEYAADYDTAYRDRGIAQDLRSRRPEWENSQTREEILQLLYRHGIRIDQDDPQAYYKMEDGLYRIEQGMMDDQIAAANRLDEYAQTSAASVRRGNLEKDAARMRAHLDDVIDRYDPSFIKDTGDDAASWRHEIEMIADESGYTARMGEIDWNGPDPQGQIRNLRTWFDVGATEPESALRRDVNATDYGDLWEYDQAVQRVARREAEEKAKQDAYRKTVDDLYAQLSAKDDFAEKSLYIPPESSGTVNRAEATWNPLASRGISSDWIEYMYANDPTIRDVVNAMVPGVRENGYAQMDERELAEFNYLWLTEGRERAIRFAEDEIGEQLRAKANQESAEYNAKLAEENPVIMSGLSSINMAASAFEAPYAMLSALSGDEKTANMFTQNTRQASAIRGQITQDLNEISPALGVLYNAAMSGVDMTLAGVLSGAYGGKLVDVSQASKAGIQFIMSSEAAMSTLVEGMDQGKDAKTVVALSIASGIAEWFGEGASIEVFFSDPKSALSHLFKSGLAEGSEEVVTNWANRLAEIEIEGDENPMQKDRDYLISKGVPPEEADKVVIAGLIDEDINAAIQGFVAGDMFALTGIVSDSYYKTMEQREFARWYDRTNQAMAGRAYELNERFGEGMGASFEGATTGDEYLAAVQHKAERYMQDGADRVARNRAAAEEAMPEAVPEAAPEAVPETAQTADDTAQAEAERDAAQSAFADAYTLQQAANEEGGADEAALMELAEEVNEQLPEGQRLDLSGFGTVKEAVRSLWEKTYALYTQAEDRVRAAQAAQDTGRSTGTAAREALQGLGEQMRTESQAQEAAIAETGSGTSEAAAQARTAGREAAEEQQPGSVDYETAKQIRDAALRARMGDLRNLSKDVAGTQVTENGQKATVTGVKTEDGELVVTVDEGGETKDVALADIDTADDLALRDILTTAKRFGPAASAVYEGYRASRKGAAEYITDLRIAEMYGRSTMTIDQAIARGQANGIDEQTVKTGYYAGQIARASQQATEARTTASQHERAMKGVAQAEGTTSNLAETVRATQGISKERAKALSMTDALIRSLGMNVEWFASETNADGIRTDENGSYHAGTNTIRMDVFAGSDTADVSRVQINGTMMHELTHAARAWAGSGTWGRYRDFVLQHSYQADGSFERAIEDRAAMYEAEGKTREEALDLAEEEIVADASAKVELDEELLRDLAREDMNLFERVVDHISEMFDRLRDAFRQLREDGRWNADAERMEKVIGEQSQLWNEMIREVRGNISLAKQQLPAGLEADQTRMSYAQAEKTHETADAYQEELGVSEETAQEMVDIGYKKPDGGLFSVRTMDAWEKAIYEMADKDMLENDGSMEVVNMVKRIGDKVLSDAMLRMYERHGLPGGNPIRSNTEYTYTFDMDTLCPRTYRFRTYRALVEQKIGRRLTEVEARSLIESMRAIKEDIPCTYCYVESKRMALYDAYNRYMDVYDAAHNGGDVNKAYALLGKSIYDPETGFKTSTDKDTKDKNLTKAARVWKERVDGWAAQGKTQWNRETLHQAYASAERIIYEMLDEKYVKDPGCWVEDTKTSRVIEGETYTYKDFKLPYRTSAKSIAKGICRENGIQWKEKAKSGAQCQIEAMVAQWLNDVKSNRDHVLDPNVDTEKWGIDAEALNLHHEAMKYAASSSQAHAVENYAPYSDQLLKAKIKLKGDINARGGIRIHSNNDFMTENMIDYLQFLTHLAMDKRGGFGWKAHAYTKDATFARLNRKTGLRVNMSIAMNGDFVRGIRENSFEGMSWSLARDERAANDNAGIMAMVTNDDQLTMALCADWIDMIIPFHASGMPVELYKDVMAWQDYTGSQNDKPLSADGMRDALKAGVSQEEAARIDKLTGDALRAAYAERFDLLESYWVRANQDPKKLADVRARWAEDHKGDGMPEPKWVVNDTGIWYESKNAQGIKLLPGDQYRGGITKDDVKTETQRQQYIREGKIIAGFAVGLDLEGKPMKEQNRILKESYLALCKRYGIRPRFDGVQVRELVGTDEKGNPIYSADTINIVDHENYAKVLKETARMDSVQEDIKADFDEEWIMETLQGTAAAKSKEGVNRPFDTGMIDRFVREQIKNQRPMGWLSIREAYNQAAINGNDEMTERLDAWESAGIDGITPQQLRDMEERIAKGVDEAKWLKKNKRALLRGETTAATDNGTRQSRRGTPEAITEERDRTYLAAVKRGDIATARRMVEEAARAAGYTEHVYHGSDRFGFTAFDMSKQDDGISIFTAYDRDVAGTYQKSGDKNVRSVARGRSDGGTYGLYANPEYAIEIDAKGANWNRIRVDMDMDPYGEIRDSETGEPLDYATTRDLARWARKHAHSLLIKNVVDMGKYARGAKKAGDILVLFDPKLVKSADPVTYDKNRNVIPLSKRFNIQESDIRNSRRVPYRLSDTEVLSGAAQIKGTNERENEVLGRYREEQKRVKALRAELDNTGSLLDSAANTDAGRAYEKLLDEKDKLEKKIARKGEKLNEQEAKQYKEALDQIDMYRKKIAQNEGAIKAAKDAGRPEEAARLTRQNEALERSIGFAQQTVDAYGEDTNGKAQARLNEVNRQLAEMEKDPRVKEVMKLKQDVRNIRRAIAGANDRMKAMQQSGALKGVIDRERQRILDNLGVGHGSEAQEYAKNIRNALDREHYRQMAVGTAKQLIKSINTKDKKLRVPDQLVAPLVDFLKRLDIRETDDRTLEDREIADSMRRLGVTMQEIEKGIETDSNVGEGMVDLAGWLDLPEGYAYQWNRIAQQVTEAAKKQGGILRNMSLDDMKSMAETLTVLRTAVNNANAFLAENRYRNANNAAQDTIDELAGFQERTKTTQAGDKLRSFFGWHNMTPYYAFKRMGKAAQSMFTELQDGWDKLNGHLDEIMAFRATAYTDQEVRAWEKETHEIKLPDGGFTVELTTAQIMSIYCLSRRGSAAYQHMLQGGIRIDEHKSGSRTARNTTNIHVTMQDLGAICDVLTDRQIEVAQKLQEFMSDTCAQWGNRVTMTMYGIRFFTEKNYFPMKTVDEGRNISTRENTPSLYKLMNQSFMNRLNPKASSALVIQDVFDVFTDHAANMAKMESLGLPMTDMLKWLNYNETHYRTEAGNPVQTRDDISVRVALRRAFGADAVDYIRTLIEDINGTSEAGRDYGTGGMLMASYKVASVAGNMRVVIQQHTSYWRAGSMISNKYLIKALGTRLTGQAQKAIQEVGIAGWKSKGYYDTGIQRSMRSLIKSEGSWKDKVNDKLMSLAGKADDMTWGRIYTAVELETEDRVKKGEIDVEKGSDAWKKIVNDRMREIVYATQVVDSTLTRSQIMRAKGVWNKSLTAFMAEPTLTYSMIMSEIAGIMDDRQQGMTAGEIARRHKGALIRTGAAVLASKLAVVIAQSVADAFRDDDDYETFQEKIEAAMIDNGLQEINPLTSIPVVKDIWNLLQGNDSGNMTGALFSDVTKTIDMYAKILTGNGTGSRTAWGVVYQTVRTIDRALGTGTANVARDISAVWNTATRAVGLDMQLQTYADTKAKGYDALMEAILSGDEQRISELKEELLSNGVEIEETQKGMATRIQKAYIAGDIDEETATEWMEEYGGYSGDKLEDKIAAATYQRETGNKWSAKKDDYLEGKISEEEAIEYLIKYGGKTKDAAYWMIREWEGRKKYDRLDEALISGDGIEAALKELRDHGVKETTIKTSVTSGIKEGYKDGTITGAKAQQLLTKYGGKTGQQAQKTIAGWK